MALRCLCIALLGAASAAMTIVASPGGGGSATRLAARELQRYLYLLSGARTLPSIVASDDVAMAQLHSDSADSTVIYVSTAKDARGAPPCTEYGGRLKDHIMVARARSLPSARRVGSVYCVLGKDDAAVLHAAYHMLEMLGVHFSTAGVALPPVRSHSERLRVLGLSEGEAVAASPVFSTRGLQPFHDFSEGPDWWSEDEHKRVLETIAAMKGNWIGFHTYPISGPAEPATWIGLADAVNPDGTVTTGYPTTWSNTLRNGAWGYQPFNTSSFAWGAAGVFEHECFGSPVQSGDPALCPMPSTEAASIELFNRVGQLWQSVFSYAHQLGVQTTIGTETPITPPQWNPPNSTIMPLTVWYSSARDDHFVTATACAECDGLYTLQGTEGWLYAGPMPGTIPLSTYFSSAYEDNVLVSGPPPDDTYGFVRIEGYAFPPRSGQNGTVLLQQMEKGNHHWAAAAGAISNATMAGFLPAGSIADILASGPPFPVGPSAQDWYEGLFTRLMALHGSDLDYFWVWTPEEWEWNAVNISNPLVQNVVSDTQAIQAAHDAVGAPFKLATCGWVVGPMGARWYFDTVLPANWTLGSIDMNLGNDDVDPNYANITHRTMANKVGFHSRKVLRIVVSETVGITNPVPKPAYVQYVIPWAEDDPGLTAPELWVNRTLSHCREAVGYGIGGLMMIHWRTRMTSPQISAAHAFAWNPSLTVAAFWSTWAEAQFGGSVAPHAAAIFAAIDSYNLPRPVNWINGPGGVANSSWYCNWESVYTWVDQFTALRPTLVAAIDAGNGDFNQLERFDYWGYQFVYMRSIAKVECDWASYNALIANIQGMSDPGQRQQAARNQGFPARISLVENVTSMMWDVMSSLTGIDTAGTVHNLLAHSLYQAVGAVPTQLLEQLAGEPLPAEAMPPTTYDPQRAPVLRVPTVRTLLASGEPFRMRALVITTPAQAPVNVTLYTRPLGGGGPETVAPLQQAPPEGGVPRFVYTATLPAPSASFEWYVLATLPRNTSAYTNGLGIPAGTIITENSVELFFPPTAPAVWQTVVLM